MYLTRDLEPFDIKGQYINKKCLTAHNLDMPYFVLHKNIFTSNLVYLSNKLITNKFITVGFINLTRYLQSTY